MGDIRECFGCNEHTHMDSSEICIVCGEWFCGACDYEKGVRMSDIEADRYYICKECLSLGLDYINKDNMDDAVFSKDEYTRAIESFRK